MNWKWSSKKKEVASIPPLPLARRKVATTTYSPRRKRSGPGSPPRPPPYHLRNLWKERKKRVQS